MFDSEDVRNSLENGEHYDLGDFDDAEISIDFDDPENNPNVAVYEDEDVSYRDENYDYPDDDILDAEDLEDPEN